MGSMRKVVVLAVAVSAVALTGCAAEAAPAPTVTVTVEAEPETVVSGDAWQRFKDDPREAFIFSSVYETIWGAPLGNGELADSVVELVHTMCTRVEEGATWVELEELLDPEDADKYIVTAQVYCPDVGM